MDMSKDNIIDLQYVNYLQKSKEYARIDSEQEH